MARTLSRGCEGEDVRATQDMLNYHIRRQDPLDPDGRFGPKTDARVRLFQTARKLQVDGIVGRDTRSDLFEFLSYSSQIVVIPPLTLPGFRAAGGANGIRPPRLIPPLTLPNQPTTPQLMLTPPIQLRAPILLNSVSAASFATVQQPSILNVKFTVAPVKAPDSPVLRAHQYTLKLLNDLPLESKVKAFLVNLVPNPIQVISEPKNSVTFNPFSPKYNPFDPNKLSNTAEAGFSIRIFGRPGDVTPQVALQGRAEGKVEMEYTGRAASGMFKFSSEWNFALGLGGTF